MDGRVLLDATGGDRKTKGAAETIPVHGPIRSRRGIGLAGPTSGKQPDGMAMGPPMSAKYLEGWFGQGNVTIFVAFSRPNMKHHAGAIDLRYLELEAFLEPQAAGIDDGQTDTILGDLDLGQDAAHILGTENDGKFVFFGRTN